MSTRPMSDPEETPDVYGGFPRLSEAQISVLAALGERRNAPTGQVLVAEGSPTCDFYLVLRGMAAVVEGHGTPDEHVISMHGPGRFLGELSLLRGEVSALHHHHGRARGGASRPGRPAAGTGDPGPGARQPDPAGLPHPAVDPDRARRGHADHRVALLGGHAPPARVRRPQPPPAPVDRPGRRSRSRGAAAPPERPAGAHPGGDPAGRQAAARILPSPNWPPRWAWPHPSRPPRSATW